MRITRQMAALSCLLSFAAKSHAEDFSPIPRTNEVSRVYVSSNSFQAVFSVRDLNLPPAMASLVPFEQWELACHDGDPKNCSLTRITMLGSDPNRPCNFKVDQYTTDGKPWGLNVEGWTRESGRMKFSFARPALRDSWDRSYFELQYDPSKSPGAILGFSDLTPQGRFATNFIVPEGSERLAPFCRFVRLGLDDSFNVRFREIIRRDGVAIPELAIDAFRRCQSAKTDMAAKGLKRGQPLPRDSHLPIIGECLPLLELPSRTQKDVEYMLAPQ